MLICERCVSFIMATASLQLGLCQFAVSADRCVQQHDSSAHPASAILARPSGVSRMLAAVAGWCQTGPCIRAKSAEHRLRSPLLMSRCRMLLCSISTC